LFKKEEEDFRKDEEYLITPPTSLVEKKILKGGLQHFKLSFSFTHKDKYM